MHKPSGKVPYTIPGTSEETSKIQNVNAVEKGYIGYDKNPSIFYWDGDYYMFVNGKKSNESEEILKLYLSSDPTNSTLWKLSVDSFTLHCNIYIGSDCCLDII